MHLRYRLHLPLPALPFIVTAILATPVHAEQVNEAWRVPIEGAHSVSVNPTDGSCWVAAAGHYDIPTVGFTGSTLTHLTVDGSQLWQSQEFSSLTAVAVSPVDGSCWVSDAESALVSHLAADGTIITVRGGFSIPLRPAVNASDGSCWLGDDDQVVHLAASGAEVLRSTGFVALGALSVNPTDGSVWVTDSVAEQAIHLAPDGAELWRESGLSHAWGISVNPTDGSAWVGGTRIVHLREDGTRLWTAPDYGGSSVSVNSVDGSCWIGDGPRVAHFLADGTEAWRASMSGWQVVGVAVDPRDGSCLVADFDGGVVRLAIQADFLDVPYYHWAFQQVEACHAAGIVQGYSSGNYAPSDPVNRAQMAVYIARALVTPSGDSAIPDPEPPPTFSDVAADHWAYRWVEYAVSRGIAQGYPDGTYHPDELVNRAQMVVYMARAHAGGDEAVPDDTDGPTFTDVAETGEWAWSYRYVEYCGTNSIVQGYSDDTYRPANVVTRDQMAVYVARAFGLPLHP